LELPTTVKPENPWKAVISVVTDVVPDVVTPAIPLLGTVVIAVAPVVVIVRLFPEYWEWRSDSVTPPDGRLTTSWLSELLLTTILPVGAEL
jgi:hypothetical protein